MVGQLVIGVLRSSMNETSLSNQLLRSIESSISYSFAKLSGFCKLVYVYDFFLANHSIVFSNPELLQDFGLHD